MLTFQEGYELLVDEFGKLDLYDSVVPGICLACGMIEDSLEPDVYAGKCHECGQDGLYSATELVIV